MNTLLKNNFNIHLRGKNEDRDWGPLSIHMAANRGNQTYVKQLLERGASVHDRFVAFTDIEPADALISTLLGQTGDSKDTNQRLKILDLLYKYGANFCQKRKGIPLAKATEMNLGANSPLTKRVKFYAEKLEKTKRKPTTVMKKATRTKKS